MNPTHPSPMSARPRTIWLVTYKRIDTHLPDLNNNIIQLREAFPTQQEAEIRASDLHDDFSDLVAWGLDFRTWDPVVEEVRWFDSAVEALGRGYPP
ncbi:hypothetical protein LTR62_008721 [Meristemomyces frigidus]|uniref:Uncharacterized protein n=1 Tax=Meristemomyces frigidus TaxID=1508187 RepID=A0AAN7YH11_9PEZI|nr:hypothetical protein LTR62_008721 [Meristemomyces frigidus]